MSSLGEKLQKVQQSFGFTQKQLAEKAGVHFKSLNNYLTGRTTPNADVLERLCRQLNLSPSWLLLGEGEMLAERNGHGLELAGKKRAGVIKAFAWIGQTKKQKTRKTLSVLLRLERNDRFAQLYEQIGPKKFTAELVRRLGAVSQQMDLMEWEILTVYCAYQTVKISEQYERKSEILDEIAYSRGNGSWISKKLFKLFRSRELKFESAWRSVLEMKAFQ